MYSSLLLIPCIKGIPCHIQSYLVDVVPRAAFTGSEDLAKYQEHWVYCLHSKCDRKTPQGKLCRNLRQHVMTEVNEILAWMFPERYPFSANESTPAMKLGPTQTGYVALPVALEGADALGASGSAPSVVSVQGASGSAPSAVSVQGADALGASGSADDSDEEDGIGGLHGGGGGGGAGAGAGGHVPDETITKLSTHNTTPTDMDPLRQLRFVYTKLCDDIRKARVQHNLTIQELLTNKEVRLYLVIADSLGIVKVRNALQNAYSTN